MDIIVAVLLLLALASAVEVRHRRTASSGRPGFSPRDTRPGRDSHRRDSHRHANQARHHDSHRHANQHHARADSDARRLGADLLAVAQRQDGAVVCRWAGLLGAAGSAVPFQRAPLPVDCTGAPAWGRGSPPGWSGRAARAELLRLRGPNGSPRSAR